MTAANYNYTYDNKVNQECNKGIDDDGKGSLSNLWRLVPAVVAAYNTGQAVDYALKQYNIAKTYLKISQWWRSYYNAYFKPLEDQELSDTMALTETAPYYDTMRGRAQTLGRLKFKNAVNKVVQCTSEYCTGLRQQLLFEASEQEARAIATLTGAGYRNERAYYESRSDVRWKRMIATATRGRDMQADAVNSAQLAYGIYGNLGQQATEGAVGAAAAFSYFSNRNNTLYPGFMRGTLNRQQSAPAGTAGTAGANPSSGYVRDPNGNLTAADPQQMG